MFPLYLGGLSNFQLKSDRRFSILRDNRLSEEVLSLEDVLDSILVKIARHAPTPEEKSLAMKLFFDSRHYLQSNLMNRDYLNFPKEPNRLYDVDPGEETLMGDAAEDEAYSKYMQKWNRKLKKGKISYEKWVAAVSVWARKDLDARMALIANMEQ